MEAKHLFFWFGVLIFLATCTYNITLVHSCGSGSDLVDETASTDVKADAKIPLTP